MSFPTSKCTPSIGKFGTPVGSVICENNIGLPQGFTKVQKTLGGWMNATRHETLTCPANQVPISTSVYSHRQLCAWLIKWVWVDTWRSRQTDPTRGSGDGHCVPR